MITVQEELGLHQPQQVDSAPLPAATAATSCGSGASGGPTPLVLRTPTAPPRRALRSMCRVTGCTHSLSTPYNRKHRICKQHSRAVSWTDADGVVWRFCSQVRRGGQGPVAACEWQARLQQATCPWV